MSQIELSVLPKLLARKETEILNAWMAAPASAGALQKSGLTKEVLQGWSADLLGSLRETVQKGFDGDIQSSGWARSREILSDLSKNLSKRGVSPTDVATFVLALRQPLFRMLQAETTNSPDVFATEEGAVSQVLDGLALFTTEESMQTRDELIARQQTEMLELSTPVVKLWDGILALPLIGTLDSERTQVVMENLLQEIVRTGAGLAIIDITGVPTVDTLVAQHLLKTVAAARLMGAECIISGIRPQIASTIVHLGVDLGDVSTKATLADALAIALKKMHLMVTKIPAQAR